MSLIRAQNDWKRFLNGGFSVEITLTPPNSEDSTVVKALVGNHHSSVGTDGMPINSRNVHFSVNESDLVALEYPVRNAKGEVSLINHKVSYADSTGITKNYTIKETFPDETVGIITCILSNGSKN